MTHEDLNVLLDDSHRQPLINDLASKVEEIISAQSGLGGMALKTAVGAAKKVREDIIPKGINRLLPDILAKLQPHWAEFNSSEGSDFGAFAAERANAISEDVLAVADDHASSLSSGPLEKVYSSVRGKGSDIIEPYLPDLARLIQKHMN